MNLHHNEFVRIIKNYRINYEDDLKHLPIIQFLPVIPDQEIFKVFLGHLTNNQGNRNKARLLFLTPKTLLKSLNLRHVWKVFHIVFDSKVH